MRVRTYWFPVFLRGLPGSSARHIRNDQPHVEAISPPLDCSSRVASPGRHDTALSARWICARRRVPMIGSIAFMSSTARDPRQRALKRGLQPRSRDRSCPSRVGVTPRMRATRPITSRSPVTPLTRARRGSLGGGARKLPSPSSQPASQLSSAGVANEQFTDFHPSREAVARETCPCGIYCSSERVEIAL